MAPPPNQTRRSRPGPKAAGSPLGLASLTLTGAAWLAAIGWASAPSVSRLDPRWQSLAWIPDWAWLLGAAIPGVLAALFVIGVPSKRLVRAGVAVLAMSGPLWGTLSRDVGWPGAAPEPRVRLVYLNAQSPSEPSAVVDIEAIASLDPDLVLVLNPGAIAPVWRRLLEETPAVEGGESWWIRWIDPVMAASPHGDCSIRTAASGRDVRAVSVSLPERIADRLGIATVLMVDLPSDPELDREMVADRLEESLRGRGSPALDSHDLVIGDFNMTPRTPAMVRLRGDLDDLVSGGGEGWLATWPRGGPLLRIDQVLGHLDGDVRIRTFDPGSGEHLGYVIDLPVAKAPGDQ